MKEIYFAGGCFWGTEHYFKMVKGVVETQVGYANGHTENPTYQDVCTDKTGFAETVRVAYDPEVISLEFLTEMYFKAIDPTCVNQQGHDVGTQYRTGIYYTDEADVPTLQAVYNRVQAEVKLRLAVELCLRWQKRLTDSSSHAAKTGCHLALALTAVGSLQAMGVEAPEAGSRVARAHLARIFSPREPLAISALHGRGTVRAAGAGQELPGHRL